VHHVLICILVVKFVLLDDDCEGEGGLLAWFYNDECFVSVNKNHVYINFITCGYLFTDFII